MHLDVSPCCHSGPVSETETLILANKAAWRAWLDTHESVHQGVWLVLAKKGTTRPTSLRYAEALDEALCSGWIDGQTLKRDEGTYQQRFTPRRARSIWSARNVGYIARLEEQGRMRERGRAEVERAKGDGRWDAAYGGSATIEPSAEMAAALAADPAAAEYLETLTASERFVVLFRTRTQTTPGGRERAAQRMVAKLARGEKP